MHAHSWPDRAAQPGRLGTGPSASRALILGYATILAALAVPGILDFPAVFVGLLAYPAMHLLCPACRVDLSVPLSPRNWAQLLFFIQLVVMPLSMALLGPATGTLPRLPSPFAINASITLIGLSYVAFCLGYQYAATRTPPRGGRGLGQAGSDPAKMRGYVTAHLALGAVGLGCSFGGLGGLIQYYTAPAEAKFAVEELAGTLAGAAGTFLKPFFGFAFVISWCNWADRRGRSCATASKVAVTAILATLVILGYSTFNYNRGAFVAPLIALAAVYLTRVQRLPLGVLVLIAAATLTLLIAWGTYRSANASVGSDAGSLAAATDLNEQFQVYGGAPQYLGFLLEESRYAGSLSWGTTLLSSALYPLPVIGESFRPTSGVVLYNEMIYGKTGNLDQVISFQGELFLNFHVVGVIAGFVLLGLLASRLQKAFEEASTSLEAFIWMYSSVWTLFLILGSLAVVSQILIYFFWPIYLYALSKVALKFLRRPGSGRRDHA